MKAFLVFLAAAIAAAQPSLAQVAINNDGSSAHASAMLDIKNTSRGLLLPRMTTAQRNAIVSPATGLMVYDTNVNKFFFYAAGNWIEMGTGSATNYWTQNGADIYKNNAGNVGIGISAPLATLDVARGTAANGTALFRGTTHASSFNYGTAEDTYIRGGKDLSNVIINDNNLGRVGIGTASPAVTLHIAGLSAEILRVQGVNPYISFHNINTPTGYVQAFGNDLLVGTMNGNASGAIRFYNNNVNHITILANGYTGIGTTNPQAQLHVNRNTEALRVSGFNSFLSVYDNSGNGVGYFQNNGGSLDVGTFVANTNGELRLKTKGQLGLTVQSDGRVKVGNSGCTIPVGFDNADPLGIMQIPKFSVQGPLGFKKHYADGSGEWALMYDRIDINFTPNENIFSFYYNGGRKAWIADNDGDYTSISDARLKDKMEPYKSVLPGIKELDVLTYHYKSDHTGRRSFGLLAQNLKAYFPELVSGDELNGQLGITYAKTGVLAIKAIQEQQAIIEALEKKIAMLEKKLVDLERKPAPIP